jgi:3-oxoadipate CoA-transferase, alpha subunit
MIDKFVRSVAEALQGVRDGATVLVPGFGDPGTPTALLEGLIEQGARDLTLVCNGAGREGSPTVRLMLLGRVRKLVCSSARPTSDAGQLFAAGKLELEIMPQGTLAERIRAAGAGIEGFYTPTGAETLLAEGREVREIGGKLCMLEYPLHGDVALLDAWQADRWGNLTFKDSQRNFNPIMAMAAKLAVAQTLHVVELGALRPEDVHTSGIFVDRVVHVPAAG